MSKIFVLAFVFTIISKLSCGITLSCNFGMGTFHFITIYRCDSSSVTIDAGSRETITVVNGTHQSGRTNADVQGLRIVGRGLEYFPVNIAQFFPNIQVLALDINSISYVNNQHLFPLPNLVYLDLDRNKITSLESHLFSGLSMQLVDFSNNNITHVGHDFILPNTLRNESFLDFRNNPCINAIAYTPSDVAALRNSLRENCQPSWLTNVNVQTQSLVNRTDGLEHNHSEMDDRVEGLTNKVSVLENRNLQLTNAVTELQQSKVELTNEVAELQESNFQLTNKVTDLEESNVELTNVVTVLTNEVADLHQNNVELTNEVTELTNELTDVQNKNSQLERRIEFVDTRAGYLEERVAVLESMIENKLGLKIDEVIGGTVN